MEVAEVLVSLALDDDAVGVVRDRDGSTWLSYSLERVAGTGVDSHQPCQQGLEGDRMLLGGLLAPGAVAAEVVDDAGERHDATAANGAWIAVLDQPIDGRISPVCCYRDSNGAPVAPALPPDWARSAVPDAEERCPACGAVAWDEVRATDDSRGMSGTPDDRMEPTPVVVCHSCGHEEPMGAITRMEIPDHEDPAEVERRVHAMHEQMRRENRETLAKVHFTIYAAEGWPASLSGSGRRDGRVDQITVSHGARAEEPAPSLQVESALNGEFHAPSEYALARRELENSMHADGNQLPVDRSDAGLIVAWRALDRERRKLVANATRRECPIVVDGQPERFTLLESGTRWAAVHRGLKLTITIAGKEIDPTTLRLAPIADALGQLL